MSSTFSNLGVPELLVSCLGELGITEPYPIQSATLSDTLCGEDVFAQSPTGSGKTLAFAIPLVVRTLASARGATGKRRPPRALVLAPTRELAAQITETICPLGRAAGLRVAAFYGGTGYRGQLDALSRGVDIVVGCPGRLIDLLVREALDLSGVEAVVIDEADRMADMGFLPAVRRLLGEIRVEHQTMLFSATLSGAVERLVKDSQHRPKRHLLERPSDDLGSRTHEFWRAKREERALLTTALVAGHSSSIVFCRTKHGADRLARQLGRSGLRVVAIHGDRSQAQRDQAIARFREGGAEVLVGTDVASRGLHVDGVECVVHFDLPEDTETYIHRSGRTGRAGASGRVVSLVCPDQERRSRILAATLGIEAPLGPPPPLLEPDLGGRFAGEIPKAAPKAQRPVARVDANRATASQRYTGSRRRAKSRRRSPAAGSPPRSLRPYSRDRRAS